MWILCATIVLQRKEYKEGKDREFMEREQEMARELLKGAYDLHVHSAPSHVKRALNDYELMEQAQAAGMAGVMIKNHYECTVGRAQALNQTGLFQTKAYGGLVLNWPTGGLNPYAVESAMRLGGRFIWLPTRDAAHCLQYGDMPGDFFSRPGIGLFDESGKLVSGFYEVLEVIKKYDAVLATGHISVLESVAACRAAREAGVRAVLTHPEWKRTVVPTEIQKELAGIGVVIERNWANIEDGDCTAEQMAQHIRAVGTENNFIATDRGQAFREPPVEGMIRFIEALLGNGFTEREIRTMVCDIPKSLLEGIEKRRTGSETKQILTVETKTA